MSVPGLDLAAFRSWYDRQRPGHIVAEPQARLIACGLSNLTYEITAGSSCWILRRPPLGHVQATDRSSCGDMLPAAPSWTMV